MRCRNAVSAAFASEPATGSPAGTKDAVAHRSTAGAVPRPGVASGFHAGTVLLGILYVVVYTSFPPCAAEVRQVERAQARALAGGHTATDWMDTR